MHKRDRNMDATPFFLMDWLDDLTGDQAEKIALIIRSQGKQEHEAFTPKLSNRKRISSSPSFPSSTLDPNTLFASSSMPELSNTLDSKGSSTNFKQRNLALGNGFNAKGLTKAKDGLWSDALTCWERALDHRLQVCDSPDDLQIANTRNNIGIALGRLGHFQAAIDSLEQAYESRLSQLGRSDPQVVSTLHNIANVYHQAGKLDLALSIFGTAKELLAGDAPDPLLLARICTSMGHVYYQAKQWVDARDAYQDALNVLLQNGTVDCEGEVYQLQRDLQELDQKILTLSTSSTRSRYFWEGSLHTLF